MSSRVHHEVLRFLVAGAVNTIATYALYLALLSVLSYTLAYTISYVAGIALAYTLSTWYVFKVRRSVHSLALFPLVYLVQYLLGMVILQLAVNILATPQKYALLVSIAVTVPVTFLLSRLLLKQRGRLAVESSTEGNHD